jgi:hypothetical protein
MNFLTSTRMMKSKPLTVSLLVQLLPHLNEERISGFLMAALLVIMTVPFTVSAASSVAYVLTPIGMLPTSCVHEVPNSSTILSNGTAISAQGVRTTFSLCSAQPASPPGGCQSNCWVMWASDVHPGGVSYFHGYWTVPSSPKSQNGQTLYLWIGTEPLDEQYLLQPVLELYDYPYQQNSWMIASWYCIPGNCLHSATFNVNQGDTIYGGVDWVYNPQINEYGWQVTTRDGTLSSILYAGDFPGSENVMTNLYVNFEAYGVVKCSDCPNAPYTPFTSLSTSYSPSWSAYYGATNGCHEYVLINSPSSVSLEYYGRA